MPRPPRFDQTLTSELSLTRKDLPLPTNPRNTARSTIIDLITHIAALTPAHPQQKTDKSWGNAVLALGHLHAAEEHLSLVNPSMLDPNTWTRRTRQATNPHLWEPSTRKSPQTARKTRPFPQKVHWYVPYAAARPRGRKMASGSSSQPSSENSTLDGLGDACVANLLQQKGFEPESISHHTSKTPSSGKLPDDFPELQLLAEVASHMDYPQHRSESPLTPLESEDEEQK